MLSLSLGLAIGDQDELISEGGAPGSTYQFLLLTMMWLV